LKILATEIIASARRQKLERAICKALDEGGSHIKEIDRSVAKTTVIAERLINDFVNHLGASRPSPPCVYDANGIGAEPEPFQKEFIVGWLQRFYQEVVDNARSGDGLVHDALQNALLGKILAEADAINLS